MARPLRIEYPGALYHLTARGNERRAIYFFDHDRNQFLHVLIQVCKNYNWICHAYCLMDNHYHLLIETPDANLSRGMRDLNSIYSQRFNRMHGRDGHLFQGRFKSFIIEKEIYLLEVARYIVLNPVRANMVSHPKEWKWSSYRATAGYRKPHKSLTIDWILGHFGKNESVAKRAYRAFVLEGINGVSC
jgi:REP element-mobilizing transposase RayT